MAQLVLGAAGAAAGFMIGGPTGAQIGWAIGSMIGGAMSQPDVKTEGPRVGDLSVTASTYGNMVPVLYGSNRANGNVIYCTNKREVATTTEEEGKGGPSVESTTYSYNVDIAIALCAVEIAGIRKVWNAGKLIYDASSGGDVGAIVGSATRSASFTVYTGTESQLPDPTIEAVVGVGRTPAYRGTAYVVFSQLDCPNGQIPQLAFEVLTTGGATAVTAVYCQVQGTAAGKGIITADGVWHFHEPAGSVVQMHFGAPGYMRHTATFPLTTPYDSTGFMQPVNGLGQPQAVRCGSGFTVPGLQYVDVFDFQAGAYLRLFQFASGSAPSNTVRLAFDSATGRYVLAAKSDATDLSYAKNPIVLGAPSGEVGSGVGDEVVVGSQTTGTRCADWTGLRLSLAMYDNVVYYLSRQVGGGTSTLTRVNGSTGALIDASVLTDSAMGEHAGTLYVDSTGVYVWLSGFVNIDPAQTARIYKVADGDWRLLCASANPPTAATETPYGFDTFYCNEEYAVVGPQNEIGTTDTYDYRVIRFEALGGDEVPVADIITDQCARAGLAPASIDVSGIEDTLHGYAIARVGSARANIEPLLRAYFIDALEEDGKVKFVKRADQPLVASIAFDELGAVEYGSEPGDPLPLTRTQEDELPRSFTVNFINKDDDYQGGSEGDSRQVTHSINDLVQELPLSTTADHAATVANVLLFDAWNARNMRRLQVLRKFAHLSPADNIEVEYPRGTWQRQLVASSNDTGVVVDLQVIDADVSLYIAQSVGTSPANPQSVAAPAPPTRQQLLDIPILRDVDNNAGIYVAMEGMAEPWPGAALFLGQDNATLLQRGAVTQAAPIGFAEGALNPWPYNVVDELSTVVVDVGEAELNSITRDAMLTGTANACALGAPGRWELLQFTTATLVSAGRYMLTGLLRGQRGTEQHAGSHAAGDVFVLLNAPGIVRPAFDVDELHQVRQYRAVTNGRPIGSALSETGVNTGQGVMPLSPVDLRKSFATNDIVLTWGRRTRLTDNWLAGVLPLGEASESYEIDIYASGTFGTLKRTLASTSPTATYTSAQQVADFGSNQTTIHARIFQLSDAVGRGHQLEASL